MGTIGLFAATRALWWASLSRRVSLLFGFFLATDFIWFVLSRIGMLDMAMCATMALGLWQWALSARGQWADRRGGRVHLVLAGLFFGLSLGGKWNGAPLLVVPGVRPSGAALGDQKRVGTPADTVRAGADWLVIGRPLRDASDPGAAADAIASEIAAG